MKLYIIRHGESENNVKGWWTGWQNPSLTEKGIADAHRARKLIEGVRFDKVYTSDLTRAIQTAQEMLPGCIYEETALLREINVGSLAGKNLAEYALKYGEALERNKKDTNYAPYGGENAAQLEARLLQFMYMAENCDGENVAAFAHAGVLRGMWRLVTGAPLGDKVLCKNCTVLVLEYLDGHWYVHSWINTQM